MLQEIGPTKTSFIFSSFFSYESNIPALTYLIKIFKSILGTIVVKHWFLETESYVAFSQFLADI